MARTRSEQVTQIMERLRTRLREGVHRPGERFLSTREVASNFGVSFQTADRLINALCDEGLLERRPASGTYIPGGFVDLIGVQLLFNPRGRRAHSFGARLLEDLTQRLDRDRISWKVAWVDDAVKIARNRLPVVWEAPQVVEECGRLRQPALLLNDRPRPGLEATFIDSVSIDDFSGGACAAQLFLRSTSGGGAQSEDTAPPELVVLSGPQDDRRSNDRRDGFLSLVPGAPVAAARGWSFEDGYEVAGEVVGQGRDGVFCCNDRLAEAVLSYCRDNDLPPPSLIGFDDAPVAEQLNLTTIALPWDEMISGASSIIKRRLAGMPGAASQLIFTPSPIIRRL